MAYYFGAGEFNSGFVWVRVAQALLFCVVLYRSLFVLLSLFFCLLCCLSFDLRHLITPLVSSVFSLRCLLNLTNNFVLHLCSSLHYIFYVILFFVLY